MLGFNIYNLDICVLRRLWLRQGQVQGFLGLKVGGGGVVSRLRNTRTDNNMAAIFTCVICIKELNKR